MYFNNDWKFFYGENEEAYYRGFKDSSWRSVTLPHDWSVEHDFDINESSGTGYLPGGTGWYRKHFKLPDIGEDSRVFVTFNGVYNNSRVWCNSNYLGKRPYGYSTFTYELTEFLKKKDNVLSVKVTRPQTADSRWFTGTGIYRDVVISVTGRYSITHLGSVFVKTSVEGDKAKLAVDFDVDGGCADVEFILRDEDLNEVARTTVTAGKGSAEIEVASPKLWSADEPNLYKLFVTVYDGKKVSDKKEIAVGIRTLEFDCDKGFFVNGKSEKLKGVCVHHDSGALGAAFYKSVWKRRLEILKAAGCNAIRTSHNPPDPLLLDLCDEMGFYVMDEAFDEWEGFKNKWWHGHNVYPPKHYGYADDFHEWHEKDLGDMVKRDRNHPSIIMWSIGNEIDYPNDPYGYFAFDKVTGNNDKNKPLKERLYSEDRPDAKRLTVVAKELVKIVKNFDETRPVTAALSFPEMCEYIGITDVLDVAGYNYKEKYYAEHREKHPKRFVFGSENGHSEDQWNYVKNNEDICGQFLWTGIDYLGEARGWPYRASGAGIMDLAGFAKNCKYTLRKILWTDEPVIEVYTLKKENEYLKSWNYNEEEKVKVAVITNLENPKICLNGKEYTSFKKEENYVYIFTVPFEKGELIAKAFYKNGNEFSDCIHTHGDELKIATNTIDDTCEERNLRLIQVEAFLQDENGVAVTDRDVEVYVEVVGKGELLGIENGDITDLTSYNSSHRKTFGGRLIAYVRTTPDAEIDIKLGIAGEAKSESKIKRTGQFLKKLANDFIK